MDGYKHSGPINCDVDIDVTNLKGTTAVVTGGANGIGEAYVRALVGAGAFVCVGDLDTKGGEKLEAEFAGKVRFVKCNVTVWEDQVQLFSEAAKFSPKGEINYVVANAGTIKQDEVYMVPDPAGEPSKPDLRIIEINLHGTLYSTKLSMHYFVKQNGVEPGPASKDCCLILIGSGAAFLDCPRGPEYSATKWAARGIMHAMRRTAFYYGGRVNVISPWYVKTNILSDEAFRAVTEKGVEFATAEDAGRCLLHILSDTAINGHSFFVSARKWAPRGYLDLDIDDYPGNELIKEIQEDQIKGAPVEAGLFG